MSAGSNIYGLPYLSLELALSNGSTATLSPGGQVFGYAYGPFYLNTVQPQLQTMDYYFARPYISPAWGFYDISDPLPGSPVLPFSVTNETPPLMLGTVGNPMLIAGYAKQRLLNGQSNVYAYLGQYFSNALVVSNGVMTTNSAGILSEYGEFFPTVPGQAALQTMPDPDQGNTNGTCLVDIVRLSLDVNHDGVMDETFTGPDNTSVFAPYVFWINNDYD